MELLMFFLFIVGVIGMAYGGSGLYWIFGRMYENTVMAIELNGVFVGFKIQSHTRDFLRSGDTANWWTIQEKDGGPEKSTLESIGLYALGEGDMPWWPLAYAKQHILKINGHEVVRPTKEGEVLRYLIFTKVYSRRTFPLLITHSFETAPVNTKDPRNNVTTTVAALFQVQIEFFNPYLAIYETPEVMENINQTLQSATRQLTATYSYIAFMSAETEGGGKKKLSDKDKKTVRKYGRELMRMVNGSIARYGARITDPDFIDSYLTDKRVEEALQEGEIETLKARAREIKGKSEKKYDQERAIGEAAYLGERIRVAGGKDELVLADIDKSKLVDAMKANQTATTLSFGGGGLGVIVDNARKTGSDDPKAKGGPRGKEKKKNPIGFNKDKT